MLNKKTGKRKTNKSVVKIKTKVNILANHNRKSNEPIRSQSKYKIQVTNAKRRKTRARRSQFVLVSVLIG